MNETRKCWYDCYYFSNNINTFKKNRIVKFHQFMLSEKGLMAIIEYKDGHVDLVPSYKIRFLTDADKTKQLLDE